MPIQQLPLMKGVGKDFRNADYIDYLLVNMLATPKENPEQQRISSLIPGHCQTL